MCFTVGRAPKHPEADEGAAEEAEPAGPGERQPEERTQQGHPGSQQAGESVQGTAETQPHTQGTKTDPVLYLLHVYTTHIAQRLLKFSLILLMKRKQFGG